MTMSILHRASYFLALVPALLVAQRQPGHPIGKVTTIGNLIHLELDTSVAPQRLFDLDHGRCVSRRTARLSRRKRLARLGCRLRPSADRSDGRAEEFFISLLGKKLGHAERRERVDHVRRDAWTAAVVAEAAASRRAIAPARAARARRLPARALSDAPDGRANLHQHGSRHRGVRRVRRIAIGAAIRERARRPSRRHVDVQ